MKIIDLWNPLIPAGSKADGYRPTLDIYLHPEGGKRSAVLVCPGGGYCMRADYEGHDIAEAYNKAGFHAFVVQYRVLPDRYPAAFMDVSRAMRIIRQNAEEWNVNSEKIAVCGFSAGGHLAATLGVHYSREKGQNAEAELNAFSNRPDALVLCYPVISFGKYGHQGSIKNLLGETPSDELIELLDLHNHVNTNTPPAFIWHTAEDKVVPVMNSIMFAQALSEKGVPFEYHVYHKGPHGLGLAVKKPHPHVAGWFDLSVEWLKENGW